MRGRTIILQQLPLSDGRVLEVSAYYLIGGMSFLAGTTTKRGYYLSAQAVTVTKSRTAEGSEVTARTVTVGDGVQQCVLPAERFSKNVLQEFAYNAHQNPIFERVKEFVLSRTHLTLAAVSSPALEKVTAV